MQGRSAGRSLRFLLDENVQRSVAVVLRERGHEVIESRSVLGTQAPDQVLRWLASEQGLIVISHDRDFRKWDPSDIPEGSRRQVQALAGRIWLRVKEPQGSAYIRRCIAAFEQEHEAALGSGSRLVLFTIKTTSYEIERSLPVEESKKENADQTSQSRRTYSHRCPYMAGCSQDGGADCLGRSD